MKPHKNELLKNLDDLNKGSYQSKHGWQIMISFKFNNWNFVYKPIWSKPLFIDEQIVMMIAIKANVLEEIFQNMPISCKSTLTSSVNQAMGRQNKVQIQQI